MTGGLAWVYDADGTFVSEPRYHEEFVEAEAFGRVDAEAQAALKSVLEGMPSGRRAAWRRRCWLTGT